MFSQRPKFHTILAFLSAVGLNSDVLYNNFNVLKYWDTKNINFLFATNGTLMVLGVPTLKQLS